ncbi:MAG: hypothetical protein AVDCRST_MAG11-3685, partial [uncultured Gemmatimonadaceae bacterium]
ETDDRHGGGGASPHRGRSRPDPARGRFGGPPRRAGRRRGRHRGR